MIGLYFGEILPSVSNKNSKQSARPQFTITISIFCQQKLDCAFGKAQFPRTLLMLKHSVIRNTDFTCCNLGK
jgi:hypothetical protein